MPGFRTRALHAGQEIDPATGAHAVPVYQTTTFAYGDAARGGRIFGGEEKGYTYSRILNPTVRAFERRVADLEGAEDAVAFASGMAAVQAAALTLLEAGDELMYLGPLYGGSEALFTTVFGRFGVTVREVESVAELQAAMGERSKLVYVETPTNPTLRVHDLAEVARIARAAGAYTVVDNTFASPYLTRPLEFGIDLALHSATKYLGGHGDATGGVLAGSAELTARLRSTGVKLAGASLGPQDAFLLLRGVKTLPLRMEAHCDGAEAVARFLEEQPGVARVYYPGLESHPDHPVAARQMRRFGGMVSIDLEGGYAAAQAFLNHLELFTQAVSLGDVESLATHPASTTHALIGREARERQGLGEGLVRLSVGIEDPEDLIADLARGLEAARQATLAAR
ncbi:methionine-gamma-lyase [Deinobacterium chartae]|uniref:Methionine-gamma-lyase n=1 Tax=Deinobacterium chartae TaxID=521158 RepID=A0A841I412_9DEIO|nr:PLP-dependent aspartate aminotransferase family protein [Deinobacterium chartae]MBB6100053.1 methionine-gamma-lyase [Deinobacterium chartae]